MGLADRETSVTALHGMRIRFLQNLPDNARTLIRNNRQTRRGVFIVLTPGTLYKELEK